MLSPIAQCANVDAGRTRSLLSSLSHQRLRPSYSRRAPRTNVLFFFIVAAEPAEGFWLHRADTGKTILQKDFGVKARIGACYHEGASGGQAWNATPKMTRPISAYPSTAMWG